MLRSRKGGKNIRREAERAEKLLELLELVHRRRKIKERMAHRMMERGGGEGGGEVTVKEQGSEIRDRWFQNAFLKNVCLDE